MYLYSYPSVPDIATVAKEAFLWEGEEDGCLVAADSSDGSSMEFSESDDDLTTVRK